MNLFGFFFLWNSELQAAVEEVLPSLKKDNVSVYYVSRTSNRDGVDSFLDKVDERSTEPIPESWRSEVTFSTPALYIYTSGTTGKNKERILKETDLSWRSSMLGWVLKCSLSLMKLNQITNTSGDLAFGLWELILFHSIWSHLGFSMLHVFSPSWYVEEIKRLIKIYRNSYDDGSNLARNRFLEFFKWSLYFDYI